ncbi:MAG: methylamine dehydrogenase accessory protein MauD [Gammaproteobacteria bacterium]|nr:methylamine dehydrogenase accessory protein MauD [Gammaproteobacteria bacterium]
MTDALIASVAVLWVLVVLLSLVVLALARQVGILHERVAPAGALMPTSGPKVGELVDEANYGDIKGESVPVGGAASGQRATLILFVSPTCPVCKSLVPTAKKMARYDGLRLIFASDGDPPERHAAYVADLDLTDYPYVISQDLGMRFGVSKLPFAVLIGADGALASKGLVNTREHLESLVEAMTSGVATLQDYVQLQQPETTDAMKESAR